MALSIERLQRTHSAHKKRLGYSGKVTDLGDRKPVLFFSYFFSMHFQSKSQQIFVVVVAIDKIILQII